MLGVGHDGSVDTKAWRKVSFAVCCSIPTLLIVANLDDVLIIPIPPIDTIRPIALMTAPGS